MIMREDIKKLRSLICECTDTRSCELHEYGMEEILDTLDALWKVADAARKLVAHCDHKPEGWDYVDNALKALEGKK